MLTFLLAVTVVFVSTGICALIEAALYAVRQPYIHRLIETNHPAGPKLERFKQEMDYPITAILIFDTILGVGGASIAGSQARALFGPSFVYWYTIVLALLLLVFAQIVPKVLGVVYNQPVARVSAWPIATVIWLFYPIVHALSLLTRRLHPDEPPKKAIEEDVRQLARISRQEGSILQIEAELIQNSLRLNEVQASEIMTPVDKVVVFSGDTTVRRAMVRFKSDTYSRIPVCDKENEDNWLGVVMSRDILFEMANDRFDVKLQELAQPIYLVAAHLRGHQLLDLFLKRRSHLFGVVGEDGRPIGVVTLEDVVEEILGDEIIDEKE